MCLQVIQGFENYLAIPHHIFAGVCVKFQLFEPDGVTQRGEGGRKEVEGVNKSLALPLCFDESPTNHCQGELMQLVGEKVPKVILQIVKVNPLGVPGHHPFDELFDIASVVILLAIRGGPGALGNLLLEPAFAVRH